MHSVTLIDNNHKETKYDMNVNQLSALMDTLEKLSTRASTGKVDAYYYSGNNLRFVLKFREKKAIPVSLEGGIEIALIPEAVGTDEFLERNMG